MQMDVFDAFEGFAGKPRREEVVDVGNLCIEEVEAFKDQAELLVKLETDFAVHG